MSSIKFVSSAALGLSLFAGAAFAQTQTGSVTGQTQAPPPAQTPPPAAAQTPAPAPVVPLPEGTKIAVLDPDAIVAGSVLGKQIQQQVSTLANKKRAELDSLETQIQGIQTKQQNSASVLTQAALAQLAKDAERLKLELQYKQSGAQTEIQNLQNELLDDLAEKMEPILEAFCKEKGLQIVFHARQGAVTWAAAGMDISAEIIKRLDAATKK